MNDNQNEIIQANYRKLLDTVWYDGDTLAHTMKNCLLYRKTLSEIHQTILSSSIWGMLQFLSLFFAELYRRESQNTYFLG